MAENFSICAYEFDLECGLGKACAVLFDCTPEGWLPQLFLTVYNGEGGNLAEGFFGRNAPILNPFRIYSSPSTKGKHRWTRLNTDLANLSFVVPQAKEAGLVGNDWTEERNSRKPVWKANRLDIDRSEFVSVRVEQYGQVAHLEENRLISQREVVIRASMELIKLSGGRIEDHYDVHDIAIRQVYLESIDIPFIKDIPISFRGVVLSQNELQQYCGIAGEALPFRSALANPEPV